MPPVNATQSLDQPPTSPSSVDADDQWGKRKFAAFLIASISVYASLGLLLLICIAVVWRRRRRLKAAAAASSAASAAAASSSPDELQQHEEMLLCKGGRGGADEIDACGRKQQQQQLNVDDLQLTDQIHSGHSAVLFQAVYRGRKCAAKLFWPDSVASVADYRAELASYRRLEQAAAAAAKKSNWTPAVSSGLFLFPELIEAGLYAEQPCLLLELVDCGSLADQLATRLYSWSDFCRLACQLCAAVAQLHSLGRAHCRLETGSFAMRAPLSPLLVGLSSCWAIAGGHLRYAAPEMLAQGHQRQQRNGSASKGPGGAAKHGSGGGPALQQQQQRLQLLTRADSYSLGLILWEVTTRCSAFYPSGAADGDVLSASASIESAHDDGDVGVGASRQGPPPYAPAFSDRLPPGVRRPSLQQVCRALLLPAAPPARQLTPPPLPVQNHPALPFIAETLAECWSPDPAARPSPASLHARFSSLAPNFV